MANIKFTVDFKGSLEIPQSDLTLVKKDENGEWNRVDPKDFSPEEIKQLVEDGDLSIIVAELLTSPNAVQIENSIDVDYVTESF